MKAAPVEGQQRKADALAHHRETRKGPNGDRNRGTENGEQGRRSDTYGAITSGFPGRKGG
jgi:hypothetical protein